MKGKWGLGNKNNYRSDFSQTLHKYASIRRCTFTYIAHTLSLPLSLSLSHTTHQHRAGISFGASPRLPSPIGPSYEKGRDNISQLGNHLPRATLTLLKVLTLQGYSILHWCWISSAVLTIFFDTGAVETVLTLHLYTERWTKDSTQWWLSSSK